ncbi:hypothetical protein [Streptomyces sp. RP5T]|uniref:hypothetical protein n=1 Tax=Streptomyces sp. RP5T TaxID=2490848 RepID=UPI000F653DD3|nr:hypothetical protein [Streptomyces sp. RP5T]RRR76857.1 hypothetical protein EHS43_29635 [Streptomyces sp. RP5T]
MATSITASPPAGVGTATFRDDIANVPGTHRGVVDGEFLPLAVTGLHWLPTGPRRFPDAGAGMRSRLPAAQPVMATRR